MLVLMRKVGERIVLDGGITVCVTKITPGKVWLGFEAPAAVKILREEIAGERPKAGNGKREDGEKAADCRPPAAHSRPRRCPHCGAGHAKMLNDQGLVRCYNCGGMFDL